MTMQAYPVQIERGKIRSTDGSTLPEHAYAVLVVLPEPSSSHAEEWQKSFDAYFAVVQQHPPLQSLDTLQDDQLNQLVHTSRVS